MKIANIYVENFKSFEKQDIVFKDFSIILGANASGKSNTISLFRFISNIITYGIDDAISLLGGIKYLRNASLSKNHSIHMCFTLDCSDEMWLRIVDRKNGKALRLKEVFYKFTINANKRGGGYKIDTDHLRMTYDCFYIDSTKAKLDKDRIKNTFQEYIAVFEKYRGKVTCKISSNDDYKQDSIKAALGYDYFTRLVNEDKGELILNKLDFLMPPAFLGNGLIRFYDFDPKLLKRSCSITTIKSLEEDGSNLANVLQGIIKNKSSRRKLQNILSECLPFIDSIKVENNIDNSVSYTIRENYNNQTFYANFLSDGTVNILALIVALFFESSRIMVIEEPERNLHPKLMSKIVDMARETAKEKQVIITTHNPEFVKYAEIDDVLFTSRCNKGFTSVNSLSSNKEVTQFLSSDLGIEDLFIHNLLG